ncbi:MAG: hypothetical protein V2B19_05465 [Pseudomonadota bacterium]
MTEPQEKAQITAGAFAYMANGESRGHGPGEQEKPKDRTTAEEGKLGWILLWALGVPIPVLLVLFLLRGCT